MARFSPLHSPCTPRAASVAVGGFFLASSPCALNTLAVDWPADGSPTVRPGPGAGAQRARQLPSRLCEVSCASPFLCVTVPEEGWCSGSRVPLQSLLEVKDLPFRH